MKERGPLSGIKVLEMAGFISGPYAAMLLADLGAEVVKVERPGTGDAFRKWGGHRGRARPQFSAYNRNKKSVEIDVTTEEGRAVYYSLASRADVLIENFRPGKMSRNQVGYEDLKEANPGLVYCSISGYGQHGPFAQRPAYDSIGLALSGLWSRFVDLKAPKAIGPNLADQLTSLYAVHGILAALYHQARTGVGQRVDVSLLLSNMAFLTEPIANYFEIGEVGHPDTRARRSQSYAVVCADGCPMTVHISSIDHFWRGVVKCIERPELLEDERFATNVERVAHYDELRLELEKAFAAESREYWLERLRELDVPAAPILTIDEAVRSPEATYLRAIQTYGDGEKGVKLVRSPLDFSATQFEGGTEPPDLGAHNHLVDSLFGGGSE